MLTGPKRYYSPSVYPPMREAPDGYWITYEYHTKDREALVQQAATYKKLADDRGASLSLQVDATQRALAERDEARASDLQTGEVLAQTHRAHTAANAELAALRAKYKMLRSRVEGFAQHLHDEGHETLSIDLMDVVGRED